MSQELDLHKHFKNLPEPRIERCRRHNLLDMITIAVCAIVAGAESWTEIESFGKAKKDWFAGFLELPNGIASHDTFGRLFSALDPKEFEKCFLSWIRSLIALKPSKLLSIDGKRVRGSYDTRNNKAAIHMVSAWCDENNLSLGHVKTEEKSNEITAIPQLIELLDIKDSVVTIDAMGCQKDIAQKIKDAAGDYILGLKGNQKNIQEDVKEAFVYHQKFSYTKTSHDIFIESEKGHGRIERREVVVLPASAIFWDDNATSNWKGLEHIVQVNSTRITGTQKTQETRYYLSSLKTLSSERHAYMIRNHWGIENKVHWCLDVSFNEDKSRVRIGNGAENFSTLRRFALNILKNDNSKKIGVKAKRMVAGWDEKYLIKLLFAT